MGFTRGTAQHSPVCSETDHWARIRREIRSVGIQSVFPVEYLRWLPTGCYNSAPEKFVPKSTSSAPYSETKAHALTFMLPGAQRRPYNREPVVHPGF